MAAEEVEVIEALQEDSATSDRPALKEEDKYRILQCLEHYPCLWDSSKPEYKSKAVKTTALKTLANNFNLTIDGVKKLIHSIRSSLVREMKREQEGQTTKWKFYDTVSYMKADVLRGIKVKEEKEWTDGESEQLVEFYKENENLWNHRLPSYRDRGLRNVALQKLGELLRSKSQDDIKKQWNMLKTIFYRESKKEEGSRVSGAGTDSTYTSQWKFFQMMTFLKGFDQADCPTTTMEEVVTVPHERRPKKKIKSDMASSVEVTKLELYKEVIKCLRTPSVPVVEPSTQATNDEISLFVKSVESTLRRLPGRQLAIARKRINDILFDIDMESYNTVSTTAPPCGSIASPHHNAAYPMQHASLPFNPPSLTGWVE